MKKIIFVWLMIVCIPFNPAFATNYVLSSNNMTVNFYVDTDSINVVNYNPPFYAIDATIRRDDLSEGSSVLCRIRYFYDIQNKKIQSELLKISTDNGNEWMDLTFSPRDIDNDSKTANFIFFKAYNISFVNY